MGTIFSAPPIEYKVDFNMSAREALELTTPPLGAENMHPLFKKYGFTLGGIAEAWVWKSNLSEATDAEMWQMAALINLYWEKDFYYQIQQREYLLYKEDLKRWAKKNPEFLRTIYILEQMEKDK